MRSDRQLVTKAMDLLSFKRLSLQLGERKILAQISFTIEPGQILGLIGESGSGKSMLALTVMKLLPASARVGGQIHFLGQDLLALSEAQMCALRGARIGIIFQEPNLALNPLHTIGRQVAETILIHKRSFGREAARRRAQQVLERVGLPTQRFPLSLYPHELSGGQRQRVLIAMAIALQPQLLIADEPTTALDVATQADILLLLKRLVQEDGMALMLISHNLALVASLVDKVVVMRTGKIIEETSAAHLFHQRCHPYTQTLLKASSCALEWQKNPADKPLLQVKNVVCSYRLPHSVLAASVPELLAVKDVSFEIQRGESLGLVGESGCGKSTLSRAILGLIPLRDGKILLAGHPVQQQKGSQRQAGVSMQAVFQDPYGSFNPKHRVARLVSEPFYALPGSLRRRERRTRVVESLEQVGLTAADADKYIHQFSGGQRQRIAIARALITRPELIIFDEAFSALDVLIRGQILTLLADLSQRLNLAYLFISHDLLVVKSVTDRMMVMCDGQIVETGRTDEIFARPQHAYTKFLLAATPLLPDSDHK